MLIQLFKLVFLHQMICEEAAKPESEIIWWSLRLLHISPTIYIFITRSTLLPLNLTMRSLGGKQDTSFDPGIQYLHIGFILHGEIHNS